MLSFPRKWRYARSRSLTYWADSALWQKQYVDRQVLEFSQNFVARINQYLALLALPAHVTHCHT